MKIGLVFTEIAKSTSLTKNDRPAGYTALKGARGKIPLHIKDKTCI